MASRCRAAALRFLKIRPRSVFELRSKLSGKKFAPSEIDEAIVYLQSMDLLNDRAFTASWIQYRLARPFGFRRIIRELKEKGIADDIIEETAAQAKEDYAEPQAVLALAQRRAEVLKNTDPLKRKKRIFDFLFRRGFSADIIMKVIKQI